LGDFVSPQFAHHLSPYNVALGILRQESLTLWLLLKGVNEQRWKEQAKPAVASLSKKS
jgi:hypothetical protein